MTRGSASWRGIAPTLVLLGLTLTATTCRQSGEAFIRDDKNAIVIENRFIRLVVGKDGHTRSLRDLGRDTEYLDLRFPAYFAAARRGKVEFGASRVSLRGDELDLEFGGSGLQATVRVDVRPEYVTFEVLSVNQENLDELIFIDLPVTISERVARVQEWREHSETINVCRNEHFGVCLCSVNLIAHSRTTRYEPAAFRSGCYPRFGMRGAKAALIAAPADQVLPIIGQLEIEQEMSHPTFGGKWGKVAKELQKSYLFVDFTEQNVERVIETAKAGGFSYILNYAGTWAVSNGKYEVNIRNFPSGLAGVKAAMDKIHAAGLKGGAHILSGCITHTNAYASPVPDPRLLKDDMRTLAGEIGPTDTTLPLTSSPEGLPTVESPDFGSGKHVVIDNEIITYKHLRETPSYALEGCTRGAFRTTAASHRNGSRVYHLGQRWGHFVLNGDSDLLQEIAQNVADVINYCGFDQIYFDGLDGVEVNGPFFYYVGKLVQETTRRFNREVIVQGSNCAHINWHDFSRLYTIDFAILNPKRWVDHHCANRMVNARHNLMQRELGWFGYFLDTDSSESTTPDIVEYVLAKTIGWGVPWSLETNMNALERNGRTAEVLEMSKVYEELRLSDRFPESVKEVLRTPKQDFKLVKGASGTWTIHPIVYGPPQRVTLKGGTTAVEYANPYREQALKFRIKARPDPAPFGTEGNVTVLDPERASGWKGASGSPDFTFTVEQSREQVRAGRQSLKLTASNRGAGPSTWATQTLPFDQLLDLKANRPVGFWLYGDSSGAQLNVRLDDSQFYFSRSHYVTLDFSGWKYCEISEPSVDPVLEYPYPGYVLTSLRNFDFGKVASVTLLVTAVPPGKSVTCYLSRVEALKEDTAPVVNPTLIVNETAVQLPVTLEDSQYLEFWGEKEAVVYDKDGVLINRLPVSAVPRLRAGRNEVALQHQGRPGARSDLRLEVITMGDPVPGQ